MSMISLALSGPRSSDNVHISLRFFFCTMHTPISSPPLPFPPRLTMGLVAFKGARIARSTTRFFPPLTYVFFETSVISVDTTASLSADFQDDPLEFVEAFPFLPFACAEHPNLSQVEAFSAFSFFYHPQPKSNAPNPSPPPTSSNPLKLPPI